MPQHRTWRIEDRNDELSVLARQLNGDHIRLLLKCTPLPEDNVSDFCSRIVARAGLTRYQAEKAATEALILVRFPMLTALLLQGFYVPRTVSRILNDLAIVPEQLCATIDAEVVGALQPSIANQHPLSPSVAGRRIEKILTTHCPELMPDKDVDPKELDIRKGTDGSAQYNLNVSKQDHAAIQELMKTTKNKYDCSDADALLRLILGQAKVSVTLNLYKDISSTAKELFSEGGWLQGFVAEEWLERVTHVRTIGPSATKAYTPTEVQRAYVAGWDGHCRFPGCEVPAGKCDIDHIHRFEDGGQTDTDNLHLLCRHHHRLKTAGIWDVTKHPDNTETWTSHGDGHTVTTEPNGPLARTTFRQRLSRKVRVNKNPGTKSTGE